MNTGSYQLTFEERDTYLYARLGGKDSFAASLSYWNEIADKVSSLNFRKLLVHEDLIGEVADSEICEIIMDLIPSGLREVQIAFYDENPGDMPANRLGQAMANHQGGHVRIFGSLASAQQWLTEDV